MKIRHKLLGLTALAVSALLLVIGTSWLANERVMKMKNSAALVDKLEVRLLNLRRNEKDFLMRMDLKYQGKFQANYERFQSQLAMLETELDELSIAVPSLASLPEAMHSYHKGMMALIQGYQMLGLNPSEGLRRDYLEYSQALVAALPDRQAMPEAYSLMKAAELLLVSGDEAYLSQYKAAYADAGQRLEQEFGQDFTNFNHTVEQVARQLNVIGFSHKQGLRGDIRSQSHLVEKVFDEVVQQLETKAAENHSSTVRLTLVAILLVVALLIGVSLMVGRVIQRRIGGLSQLMANIAETRDLTLAADVQGNDELADMARNFNYLLSSLRQLVGNVQEAITELGAASEQLQSRSYESEEAMKQQQSETDSVATAITEMGSTIRDIATNTESAAANAERSHQGARQGLGEVSDTKERIRSLSDDLEQTSGEVASLSNLAENIGSVLDVIKEIAEQTNLLALNAAIEAARAGEQGRGFAVVADEVRSLAMRTRQSTEEITTIIASLQQQTEQVVVHIGHCREQGEMSVTQADSAEEKINQIMADMQQIMDNSTQLAAAVEQQSLAADEIGQNVVTIRDITQMNSTVAHENAQAANAVAGQAVSLDEAIAEFKV